MKRIDWSRLAEDYERLRSTTLVAREYGCDRGAVARALNRGGIPFNRSHVCIGRNGPRTIWSEQDVKVLREIAGTLPVSELAERLGRTAKGVKQKAAQIGFSVTFSSKWVVCKSCGTRFLSHHQGPGFQVCLSCKPAHNYDKSRRHESGPHYREALARAGSACERCGSARDILIHHEDGNGHGVPRSRQNHALSNLEVLCRACHRKEHSRRIGRAALSEWGRKGMAAMRGIPCPS